MVEIGEDNRLDVIVQQAPPALEAPPTAAFLQYSGGTALRLHALSSTDAPKLSEDLRLKYIEQVVRQAA